FGVFFFFFFQAEDGIRDGHVTGVQTCALPIYFGSWGRTPQNGERVTWFGDGEVYIDNLILQRSATAMQVRVTLFSYELESGVSPHIRRIAVSYSGYAPQIAAADLASIKLEKSQWARDLKVPF